MDDLVEPDFAMEQDLIVMSQDERAFSKPEVDPKLKANVLLLSYNRPRMLKEAIESVVSQSFQNFDLYIIDDGSDFDVWKLICEFVDERILFYQAEKIPLETRLESSRIGRNLNSVLSMLGRDEIVFYLCDDDIMAPEFLARALTGYTAYPDTHVVAAESWWFRDGEDWRTEAKHGMDIEQVKDGIPTAYWSTGSFAHKVSCYKDEGLRWTDSKTGHSQDTNFIMHTWKMHQEGYIYIPVPALYRREHDKTLSAKLGRKGEDGRYKVGFEPGPLQKEMLEGMME